MSGVQDSARWIVNELAEAKRLARDLGTPQLGTSSIESGKIEEYDAEGVLVQVLGEQHDGTHTTVTVNGPVPPEPMPPTVTAGLGSVEVRASGKFVAGEVSPMDLSHFSVHASRAEMFTPTNETQRSTIQGESGDLSVVLIEPGQWSFSLVAVSKAGKWSRMSDVVTVEVPDFPSPVDVQDELLLLDEKYDGVITEAGQLGDRLDQAETDLTAHGERLDDNDTTINNLTGTVLPQLQTDLTNAKEQLAPLPGLISDNTTKVNDAKTRLDTLNNTTLPGLTNDLADAKTRLSTAEGTLEPLPGKISAAEQDISDAFGQIEAADTKATNAQTLAGTAKSTADSALTMAGSKSKVYYSTSNPSGTASVGDTWRKVNASQDVVAEWRWSASNSWVSQQITSEAISNLDVGKLTSSTALIDSAVINKLAVNIATVIELNASRITAGKITAAQIDVTNLAVSIANVIKLNASAITAGTIDAARLDVNALSASIATIISLDASRITAGTINTARLNVSEIAASVATVISLNASRITSGTISTARLNAVEIAAATAAFQTVDVKNLFATTGTMSEAVINKLWADVVMSKKITAQMLAIGDFTNLAPSLRDQRDSWEFSGDVGVSASSLTPDGVRLKFFNTAGSAYAYGPYHVCEAGEMFHGEADIYRTATATSVVYIRMHWYQKDKTPSSTPYTQIAGGSVGSYPSGAHLQGSAVAPADAVYVRIGIAAGSQAGDIGVYNIVGRRMSGGELIVDGSVKAKQIDVEDLAANSAFITDLTARIVKSDMFVGKAFTGGTFTGATFQTSSVADVGIKIDSDGFRAYGDNLGQGPVVEIRPDGATTVGITDPVTGDSLASLGSDGSVSGKSINIADDPTFMGERLFGNFATYSSPNDQVVDGVLDIFPRGVIAYGLVNVQNKTTKSSSTGHMALMELGFEALTGRAYRVTMTPLSVVTNGPGHTLFSVFRTTDGTKPRLTSSAIYQSYIHGMTEGTPDRQVATYAASFIIMGGSPGTQRLLFALGSDDTKTTARVFDTALGGSFRVTVEDIGPNVPDTGVTRTDTLWDTVETQPTPPPTKKSYSKTYTATGSRSYEQNGSTYNYMTSKMFQGQSPGTSNIKKSIAVFPSMTGDLSGATITSIQCYFYFNHWYYSQGGTADIVLHGASSLPSTVPSLTNCRNITDWPKPGGKWVSIPSAYWAGFKNGTYRGVGLGDGTGGYSHYGYANGSSTKIKINYTK